MFVRIPSRGRAVPPPDIQPLWIKIKNEVTHKVEIRYSDLVDEELRIVFGTRIFKIEAMVNVGEKSRFTAGTPSPHT